MFNLIAQQRHTEAVRHGTFPGCTLWLTGFSGAGKTSIATYVKNSLDSGNVPNYMLDGDVIRQGLNCDLGFSNNDRTENIRRIAEVSRLMADAGVVCIVAFISPFIKDRNFARQLHDVADLKFYEIYVNTPIEECIRRDTKGLYARAKNGEIRGLTGIDAPYEIPERPEIIVDTLDSDVKASGERILEILREANIYNSDSISSSAITDNHNSQIITQNPTLMTDDSDSSSDNDMETDQNVNASGSSRKCRKKVGNKKRKQGRKKDRR